jgi:hypothetical protein
MQLKWEKIIQVKFKRTADFIFLSKYKREKAFSKPCKPIEVLVIYATGKEKYSRFISTKGKLNCLNNLIINF